MAGVVRTLYICYSKATLKVYSSLSRSKRLSWFAPAELAPPFPQGSSKSPTLLIRFGHSKNLSYDAICCMSDSTLSWSGSSSFRRAATGALTIKSTNFCDFRLPIHVLPSWYRPVPCSLWVTHHEHSGNDSNCNELSDFRLAPIYTAFLVWPWAHDEVYTHIGVYGWMWILLLNKLTSRKSSSGYLFRLVRYFVWSDQKRPPFPVPDLQTRWLDIFVRRRRVRQLPSRFPAHVSPRLEDSFLAYSIAGLPAESPGIVLVHA